METKERNFFVGVVELVLGALGLLFSLFNMPGIKYDWVPPVTFAEVLTTMILIVSIIVVIVGITTIKKSKEQ